MPNLVAGQRPAAAPAAADTTQLQLPSFYSPKNAAAETSSENGDVENADLSVLSAVAAAASAAEAPAPPLSPSPSYSNSHGNGPSHPPSTPSGLLAQLSQPPPSSLLSPAFTPPATPGTVTPGGTIAPLLSEPRGVPVDSSVPTGGCGNKRPRLLESLPHVECVVRARIPTTSGTEMFLHLYANNVDNKEHLAIVFGRNIRSRSLDAVRPGETELDRLVRGAYTGRLYPGRTASGLTESREAAYLAQSQQEENSLEPPPSHADGTPPLVRIHSECYTGETVWSARCDCGEQLDEAARLMALPSNTAGGIIIYLRQEGRGIGLGEKLKAYNLQDLGNDTVEANLLLRHPADARSYGLATAMLLDLGQHDIRLLTNNPDKIRAVEGPNREIVVKERVAMVPLAWKGQGGFRAPEVDDYIRTKIHKMGHLINTGPPPV
ncbi:GTP cyclohydrolase II-domain-containing protein [Cercophora scortea]|uniref:GTP cyclohydrolase II n=1 Tax=Cercophora scortea TaxID=314031 RepID=A0AAE0ILH3_9PEZI|nr:GTP cyclohydrolase II-domain-containing protein [Cercophora scortea]